MTLPLIAAGIAARAVAKKLTTRVVGGITGAGAKQVNTVYRNMGTGSVKVKPAQSTDTKINQGLARMQNDYANKMSGYRKSGGEARLQGSLTGPKTAGKKIKINSNPMKRGK